MKDFLLEIGVENIPASYIEPAFRQLCDDAESLFERLRLTYDELYATGTPRRIVLYVSGLADRQDEAEETVTGPPVNKAFDQDGNPSPAAAGFARSHGRTPAELQTIATPKGDYVGFHRRLECRATVSLMADSLPDLIGALKFPKTMKWEQSGSRFARPVRWIVCLHGKTPIRFGFAGIESGKVSFGRPWMRGERVSVTSAETYAKTMKRLGVIVDDDERRARIDTLARGAAQKNGCVLIQDEGLMYELSFMLEKPRVIAGTFPKQYLKLPSEVVTTAMRSHQRYLAMGDAKGRLVPKFITFTDGKLLGEAEVRKGNEKVLRARLEDASFYWQEDLKRGMDGLADELNRIVFIEGMGSLGQKSKRIAELAVMVNQDLAGERRVPDELIHRASRLAKADLASEMIKDGKEFTLLQGLIGSYYCGESGEDPAVVRAVGEHYQPRTPVDRLPGTVLGTVIGVADRVDTISGCYFAGFVPSGSQDPYGLRRSANGLIRILENEPSIRLDRLVDRSLKLYVREGLSDPDRAAAISPDLHEFFAGRVESGLKEKKIAYDVVAAVSGVSWMRPGIALERARGIAALRGDVTFERLITGVKRVGNILAGDMRLLGLEWEPIRAAFGPEASLSDNINYDTGLFDDPAEHNLCAAVTESIPKMVEFDKQKNFLEILSVLSRLADPIDDYFDRVLVNCDDADVRNNRHKFLASVFAVFARYADFSRIVEAGSA